MFKPGDVIIEEDYAPTDTLYGILYMVMKLDNQGYHLVFLHERFDDTSYSYSIEYIEKAHKLYTGIFRKDSY